MIYAPILGGRRGLSLYECMVAFVGLRNAFPFLVDGTDLWADYFNAVSLILCVYSLHAATNAGSV